MKTSSRQNKPRARRVPDLRHGLSYTPEYRAWQTMRHRCTCPASPAYARYGGRGITICDRWLNSPANFLADMGPRPSPRHEIDRIDNNAGYSPENCRWVVRSVNDRNRRSNHWIEYRGERRVLQEWCDLLGLPRDTVGWRLRQGWTTAMAFETPVRPKAGSSRTRHATGGGK